ncbi:hypothetical protein, partial [Streptomyces europaeiscabiei]|uniref:hypothetical protein n=1 Tax=Streptomyces europaeiscabiei TaxID=146819 RepID=UPI001ABF5908
MGIRTLRRRTATAATRLSGVRTRLTRATWARPRVRRPHSLYPWPLTHPLAALLGHVPPYAARAARPRFPSGAPTRRPRRYAGHLPRFLAPRGGHQADR